jgi:hypothetical protein
MRRLLAGVGKVLGLAKIIHLFDELHGSRPELYAGLVGWSELISPRGAQGGRQA